MLIEIIIWFQKKPNMSMWIPGSGISGCDFLKLGNAKSKVVRMVTVLNSIVGEVPYMRNAMEIDKRQKDHMMVLIKREKAMLIRLR